MHYGREGVVEHIMVATKQRKGIQEEARASPQRHISSHLLLQLSPTSYFLPPPNNDIIL
jgi:hypothetical protein